jgi:hypothetical protein
VRPCERVFGAQGGELGAEAAHGRQQRLRASADLRQLLQPGIDAPHHCVGQLPASLLAGLWDRDGGRGEGAVSC